MLNLGLARSYSRLSEFIRGQVDSDEQVSDLLHEPQAASGIHTPVRTRYAAHIAKRIRCPRI
jgi:hypothetical protein